MCVSDFMSRARWFRAAAIAVLAGGGLLWMNSFAPWQWPTVLVYTGMAVVVGGVLAFLVPPAWSGFRTRLRGLAAGFVLGGTLLAAGWFWPARSMVTASPQSRLDFLMPAYDFHERHELTIDASPERVRAALDHLSFADIRAMQTLGRIRAAAMGRTPSGREAQGVPPSAPIVEMVKQPRSGFFPLDDSPREFIFGLAGQPWNNRGIRLSPEEFRSWAPPDNVKIAANFRIEDAGAGRSRVITETRVFATDDAARRKMARYWALIYPGSGLIRRSRLRAVQERAERM
jgi:hypothetical protein